MKTHKIWFKKLRDCHVGLCPPRNDAVVLGWSFWFVWVGEKKKGVQSHAFFFGMKLLSDLADDLVHLVPLLLHIGNQLELGPAAVQILVGIVDVEVIVAV